MLQISFPQYDFKIREENNLRFIFDEVRKKWVKLTPEEWVRQNFLQYLIHKKNYPSSLISIEKEFLLNDLKKRCDIVVYKDQIPWMIIECKDSNVLLEEKVLQQILRYNMALPANYLIITNGKFSYGWQIKDHSANFLENFPEWND